MTIKLLNIDCMEYMDTCSDNQFDLAICDPPYGRGEDGGTNRTKYVKQKNGSKQLCFDGGYKKKSWDNNIPGKLYFDELSRVSRHQIIFGINYFNISLPGGRIIWDKGNDGSDQCGAEIAYCSINERVDMVRYLWRGMMQGKDTGNFVQQGNKKLNEKRIHPTQKPVKLYSWIINNYADKGQTILDTHLGSGSSAIAAHNFGCDFVGCELDEDYFKASQERFKKETSQMRLF